MPVKIGYLIPEFPGQTHIFFWREMRALQRQGVEPDVVSTRRPAKKLVSHDWAGEAMSRTTYLSPMKINDIFSAAWQFFAAGPRAWMRCAAAIGHAESVSLGGRIRLAALALMGARLARIAHQRGWKHVHVHSCADSANIALFAFLLTDLPYSMTLHGPLGDYGPNQNQKWRNASFVIIITRKLLDEVRQILPALPPIEIAPMGRGTR